MTKAQKILLNFALEQLDDTMSNAGCNDMDQSVFENLSPEEKQELYQDFLKYDKIANPFCWEPRKFSYISDISWMGYLKQVIKEK